VIKPNNLCITLTAQSDVVQQFMQRLTTQSDLVKKFTHCLRIKGDLAQKFMHYLKTERFSPKMYALFEDRVS
jgi:hypothetical protein